MQQLDQDEAGLQMHCEVAWPGLPLVLSKIAMQACADAPAVEEVAAFGPRFTVGCYESLAHALAVSAQRTLT